MSRLKSYTEVQVKRFVKLCTIATFVAIFSVIIYSILVATSVGLNFRNLVLQISNYSNLILSILTIFLVITTVFYAWITYRMLVEMMESRSAAIRPILWVDLEKPKFNIIEDASCNKLGTQQFLCMIKLSNYGRGPAINTDITLSIPYQERTDTTPYNYVRCTPIASVPTNFAPDSVHESIVDTITNVYDPNKYKEDFLKLTIKHEDIERNLYSIVKFYRLNSFKISDKKENYYWVLKGEEIYFIPFSQRKSIYDDIKGFEMFGGEGGRKLILRRRQPWK